MSRELNDVDRKIIEMFKSGVTTAQIGQEVGKTKNSICGLISRYREWGYMQEKRFGMSKEFRPKQERTKSSLMVEKRLKYLFAKPKLDKAIKKRIIPVTQISPPITGGIVFWKLKRTSCRYVLNDGLPENYKFCGEPIHNKAYCAYHASICYVKPERKYG